MPDPRILRYRADIMQALSEMSLKPTSPGTVANARKALLNLCDLAEAQTQERLFPIMDTPDIPWDMLRPHEKQALDNHDQTLKRLAERGGLSPGEALAILADKSYRDFWNGTHPDKNEAAKQLAEEVARWRRERLLTDDVREAVERLRHSIKVAKDCGYAPPYISIKDATLLCNTLVPER